MNKFSIENIKDKTERIEKLVHWLAGIFKNKNLVKKLIIADVIIFLVFNPAYFPKVLERLNYKFPVSNYWLYFTIVVGLLFVAAIIAAMRVKPKTLPSFDQIENNAIKGLRPFGFEDSEIFMRLQRQKILQECLNAILDRDFRYGIICGESGCGKTSLLRAGIWPQINQYKTSKLSPLCIYVKITHLDPFESIREAIIEQTQLSNEEIKDTNPLNIIEKVINIEKRILVLLLDQFEQFFVNNKQYEDRKPFIDALSYWYKKKHPFTVKIFVCLRGDFMDHLIELQKVMQYYLGPQDVFKLQKFFPNQAVEIMRVIADSSHLTFDENFVKELASQELCDSKDGLISPVNIQILAWVIFGYAQTGEAGFNKSVYQKIGGIDGLLENYLKRVLDVIETEEKRKMVVKVLLALVNLELNVSKGEQTIEQIQKNIGKTLAGHKLVGALNRLKGNNVRLVTSRVHNGITYYELTHERIIPALRRISSSEISEIDHANQLLEQRVNEWLGNERKSRYHLTWPDYRIIKKRFSFLNWSKRKDQKLELFLKSRRSFLRRILVGWLSATFITFAIFSLNSIGNQKILKSKLMFLAQPLSESVAPPLSFGYPEEIFHTVEEWNADGLITFVTQVAVYSEDKKVYVTWNRYGSETFPIPERLKEGLVEQDGYISIFNKIYYGNESQIIGTIFIRTDTQYYQFYIPKHYFILTILSIATALLTYIVMNRITPKWKNGDGV
jgi:hypothetical protein